ncbi:ADP-ribosylation factor-like isoform X3 [Mytilus trossulus]|uniref:ADP-ribosylation factor-like isoform X3 n=1 Tax=Mytilus trossulus TaxID=6551 RepID=UPI0030060B48
MYKSITLLRKTAILYKMKYNRNVQTISTIGFNVETITPVEGINFTVWDISFQEKMIPLWVHYFTNTEGIIYVVDSNDGDRLNEAREILHRIPNFEILKEVPLVVMANKQDLPNAICPSEIANVLNLHEVRDRRWFINGTSAPTGNGLNDSMIAMVEAIRK